MKNLDSLTLKFFYEENLSFFKGAQVQKIQMPNRKEIIFYLRNNGENRKFYINIDPKYPHICFIKDKESYNLKIPKIPPMFCMQLRKYLETSKIKDLILVKYDRILEFYFDKTDEFGTVQNIVLALEIMGKYSNVILYDKKTSLIIGSNHNVSSDKSSIREVYGGIKYIYPPKIQKHDILKTSYSTFIELKSDIQKNFYYFSKPFLEFLKDKSNNENLYEILQKAVFKPDLIKEFWGNYNSINENIYNYFQKNVNSDRMENLKNKLLKLLNSKLNKFNKALNEKIDYEKFERYKKSGDLILQYIYKIKEGEKKVIFEGVEIELDSNLSPSMNAQKYYKLYSKLKSKLEITEKRKEEIKKQKEYIEEIIFSINSADEYNSLLEIEEEVDEFILLKKNEEKEKPKVETITYLGYELLIGKNNKQNDFIIRKLSSPEDIWLHAINCPSSHLIIKTQNGKKPVLDEVLLYAANLVKNNSAYKNSKKAGIIYTKRKYLKRPPNTPLGYVTYSNEKEIII